MERKKYTPGSSVLQAQQALEEHRGKKPGSYESPWKEGLDDLLGQIRNRDPFRYDPGRDALYRQAVDRYVRLGREAMMDTVGRAAALTGGYGNSYAQTAGQQTYQRYLLSLSAKLPQFQQMALDRYQTEGEDLKSRYALLNQRDEQGRSRYEKALDRYYAQLDRLQNAYDREKDRDYHAYRADRDFEYARERDRAQDAQREEQARREQARFEAQQAYQRERDKIRDAQWERDFAESRRRYELDLALKQAAAAARASRGGGSRGGSRGGVHGGASDPSGPFGRFSREEYYRYGEDLDRARGTENPGFHYGYSHNRFNSKY